MYVTSRLSFLRSCQSILTPVSASGKDKPWYISLLWIVRTEEPFRYSSAWDTLPSTNTEGVMVHGAGHQLFHGQCIFLATSVQQLCDPSGATSLFLWFQTPALDLWRLTSEERTFYSTGQSQILANLYWTVKRLIHLFVFTLFATLWRYRNISSHGSPGSASWDLGNKLCVVVTSFHRRY